MIIIVCVALSWRRASVVSTSVFGWRTFLDICLIYSLRVTPLLYYNEIPFLCFIILLSVDDCKFEERVDCVNFFYSIYNRHLLAKFWTFTNRAFYILSRHHRHHVCLIQVLLSNATVTMIIKLKQYLD